MDMAIGQQQKLLLYFFRFLFCHIIDSVCRRAGSQLSVLSICINTSDNLIRGCRQFSHTDTNNVWIPANRGWITESAMNGTRQEKWYSSKCFTITDIWHWIKDPVLLNYMTNFSSFWGNIDVSLPVQMSLRLSRVYVCELTVYEWTICLPALSPKQLHRKSADLCGVISAVRKGMFVCHSGKTDQWYWWHAVFQLHLPRQIRSKGNGWW